MQDSKNNDSSIEVVYSEAWRAFEHRDYDRAFGMIKNVIDRCPGHLPARRLRATLFALQKNMKKAIEDICFVLDSKNVEPGDYFDAGRWSIRIGNYVIAEKYLSKALRLAEKIGDHTIYESCYIHRALALLQLRRFDESLRDCLQISEHGCLFVTRLVGKSEMEIAGRERRILIL